MSLLADLLSKKTSAGSPGGRDIPPTLLRAHVQPAEVRNVKKRFVMLASVSAVLIAGGVFAMAWFWSPAPPSAKKPAVPTQPVKAPEAVASIAAVSQYPTPQSVPVSTQTPAPTPDPAPINKSLVPPPVHEKAAPKYSPQRHVAKIRTAPRHGATRSTIRAASRKEIRATAAEPEIALPVSMDIGIRDSLLYAARTAERTGDWNSALANYRKAQKIDPDNYKIMSNAAAALNNLGMFDAGGKEAKQALAKKPDYVPAMINAAIAYSSLGNSQYALDLFSKAFSAEPTNRNIAINFGILQERNDRLDDARKTYRRLAEDGDPLALNGMGRIHERTGNRSEAIRAYRQIMALPNASAALKKEVKGKLARLE